MINQVRSRKNKGKSVFLQPLTLLDLEVYHTEKKTIHRIKDFKVNDIDLEVMHKTATINIRPYEEYWIEKHKDKIEIELLKKPQENSTGN